MNEKVFQEIAGRYGISTEALMDAWNKTRTGSHEDHVKKFKLYLHKLTGEGHYNFDIPKMDDKIAESVACEFLKMEFEIIEEEIDNQIRAMFPGQLEVLEEQLIEEEENQ